MGRKIGPVGEASARWRGSKLRGPKSYSLLGAPIITPHPEIKRYMRNARGNIDRAFVRRGSAYELKEIIYSIRSCKGVALNYMEINLYAKR